jgi:hypothetical protein
MQVFLVGHLQILQEFADRLQDACLRQDLASVTCGILQDLASRHLIMISVGDHRPAGRNREPVAIQISGPTRSFNFCREP